MVTLIFTVIVTFYAMNSKASIFKMVENAYQVTLVAAFVPWCAASTGGGRPTRGAGVDLLRASRGGWRCIWPAATTVDRAAQLAGLIARVVGMVVARW